MNATAQFMADYRQSVGKTVRQLNALERAVRRRFVAAIARFEALNELPVAKLPITAHGMARYERDREIAMKAVEQYSQIIQDMNRTGGK